MNRAIWTVWSELGRRVPNRECVSHCPPAPLGATDGPRTALSPSLMRPSVWEDWVANEMIGVPSRRARLRCTARTDTHG